VLLLAYAAYWYVYGRERDLFESTELETLSKDFDRYLRALDPNDNESKRLSDLFALRSPALSSALNARLTLAPNDTGGSTLNGSFLQNKQNWITNRVYVHIRILEKRRCGEKLHNMFSDTEWDKKCAADPTHSVMDVVEGQGYQCFVGAVEFGETAPCWAKTILQFDPTNQTWDFFFYKVTGHPKDPLNLF